MRIVQILIEQKIDELSMNQIKQKECEDYKKLLEVRIKQPKGNMKKLAHFQELIDKIDKTDLPDLKKEQQQIESSLVKLKKLPDSCYLDEGIIVDLKKIYEKELPALMQTLQNELKVLQRKPRDKETSTKISALQQGISLLKLEDGTSKKTEEKRRPKPMTPEEKRRDKAALEGIAERIEQRLGDLEKRVPIDEKSSIKSSIKQEISLTRLVAAGVVEGIFQSVNVASMFVLPATFKALYDFYTGRSRDTNRNLPTPPVAAPKKATCWARFFSCFNPRQQTQAAADSSKHNMGN